MNKKTATVQDYLDAVNAAFQSLKLSRQRNPGPSECFGCDRCCAERAPLTIIDCFVLSAVMEVKTLGGFISRYTTVSVRGPVVDITLRLLEDGRCIFLDRRNRTCRVYPVRPFVCQTFICAPAPERVMALREAVTNRGEDELVRQWLRTRRVVHYAESPGVDERDWPQTPFCGKWRYDLVPLREVVPKRLWRELLAKGKR
ncbi:MAG: YkgJ family cysteine cluster protein [Bacillota bacterium]